MRRLRRARYLTKKMPLFAFQVMQSEYQGYTYDQFLDDLRRRSKPKQKKGRSPLIRYGRYQHLQKALADYHITGDIRFAIEAQQLRKRITKPYRVLYRCKSGTFEYTLSSLIPMKCIIQLTEQLKSTTDIQQAELLIDQTRAMVTLQ